MMDMKFIKFTKYDWPHFILFNEQYRMAKVLEDDPPPHLNRKGWKIPGSYFRR